MRGEATPGEATQASPGRLRGEERRDALVEVAAALVAEGGIDAVSMESVAARAEVSRPLVYKHFANRHELLAAVYRREMAAVEAIVVDAVQRAEGFEGKLRALVHTVLESVPTYAPVFTPLVRAGVRDAAYRREERARHRRTVRFFTRLAMADYGLGEDEARAATAVLLTGIESVRIQAERHPGPERRRFLEDLYVDLVVGGLRRIAERA